MTLIFACIYGQRLHASNARVDTFAGHLENLQLYAELYQVIDKFPFTG